jgi:DNA processing protein
VKVHILGNIIGKDKKAIAVVGTRMMSQRGQRLTKDFVSELVKAGYTIVSGLARGVDTMAHQTALENGGRTIAVLGSGLDIIYPSENAELAREIIKHGALVSGFPKGTKPFPQNFLARNRIITMLSQAVLVIEGARRSGTLSTASWAANAGLEVYAIPGSEVTDYLIGEGATIAKTPFDVIKCLKQLEEN